MRNRSEPPAAPLPQRRRGAHPAWALLGIWASTLLACSTPPWIYGSGTEKPEQGTVVLSLDDWKKDSLHCAEDRCENVYAIDLDEPGRLRAEVYAPIDSGGPDFALTLLDAAGEEIARPVDDDSRPRRLDYHAEPGRYLVRVQARGDDPGPLRYELVARYEAGSPPARQPRKQKQKTTAPKTRKQPEPPAPDASSDVVVESSTDDARVLVGAEVLDVEVDESGATFVLLDVGEPQGVRKDMRGALREGDRSIGSFSIVEVYQDGSRARIEGALDRPIGIDTVAEIHH